MAIEKRIELEEDVISADIPTSDEVTAMEDGGAEVTLTDQTEIDEAEAQALALASPRVQSHVEGKSVAKTVYVPGRLVNVVVS